MNYIWLNEFNQLNIWEIRQIEGSRIFTRQLELRRERWFEEREAIGFLVWWRGQAYYVYERRGNRLLIDIKINGIGEETWIDGYEAKPLSLSENIASASHKRLQLELIDISKVA